ncbi:MAG: transposase, partial [Lachnospiraceae bacterium]|nr:transposase [Lachnospiraceae bacterium]
VKIDQWYPSSKTCCHCGSRKDDLTLSDRLYICPVCGNIIDRDLQAAINIKEEGLRLYHQEQAA